MWHKDLVITHTYLYSRRRGETKQVMASFLSHADIFDFFFTKEGTRGYICCLPRFNKALFLNSRHYYIHF